MTDQGMKTPLALGRRQRFVQGGSISWDGCPSPEAPGRVRGERAKASIPKAQARMCLVGGKSACGARMSWTC